MNKCGTNQLPSISYICSVYLLQLDRNVYILSTCVYNDLLLTVKKN